MELNFRIVNVFTLGDRLSGNPLCVFEDGRGLSDETLQALALQFNLSETTFVLPASAPGATARVRIFTPRYEMPFAGHPTLGTAHVVRSLLDCGERVVLEMKAGLVHVAGEGDTWTLRTAHPPMTRAPSASREELAAMLGLPVASVADSPLWVDTGSDQLVVPLVSPEHVLAARPLPELLARHAGQGAGKPAGTEKVLVWARTSPGAIVSRFFFVASGLAEDPATGSACANLGGWMIATRAPLPLTLQIRQGDAVGRPSQLTLTVHADEQVFVGGRVVELGRGTIAL